MRRTIRQSSPWREGDRVGDGCGPSLSWRVTHNWPDVLRPSNSVPDAPPAYLRRCRSGSVLKLPLDLWVRSAPQQHHLRWGTGGQGHRTLREDSWEDVSPKDISYIINCIPLPVPPHPSLTHLCPLPDRDLDPMQHQRKALLFSQPVVRRKCGSVGDLVWDNTVGPIIPLVNHNTGTKTPPIIPPGLHTSI